MSAINLCLVGLTRNFTDDICRKLAMHLEMFYADAQDLVDYELNVEDMEKICGKDYLLKKKKSLIFNIFSYENAVINLDYAFLNDREIYEHVKSKSLIIFLKMDKPKFLTELDKENLTSSVKMINTDLFEDRQKILENLSHITVVFKSDDTIIEDIEKKLINYYR